jgi:zinc transport system substrate-binding protein
MVKPGFSPHTYEPKVSQMIRLSDSTLYFSMGAEFEKAWVYRLKDQNRNLKIIDLSTGIKKINNNPHIWLSVSNVEKISKKILSSLIKYDSDNKEFYVKNYNKFKIKLKKLKKAIQNITQKAKNRKFLVLHPAFVYFANEYGLEQIPIEANGKKPSLKEIIKLLSIAKKEKIKTLIVSPEFSQKSANIIAKELNIKVTKISPLSLEWDKNLIRLSKAISQ